MTCWRITRAREATTISTYRTSGLPTMVMTTTTMWMLNITTMHRKYPQTKGVTLNIEVEDQVVVAMDVDAEMVVDTETSIDLGLQQEHFPTQNCTWPNMMRKKKRAMSTAITNKIIHTSPLTLPTLHIPSHFFMLSPTSSTTIFNQIGLYFWTVAHPPTLFPRRLFYMTYMR